MLPASGKKARALDVARAAAARWPEDGETRHLLGFLDFQTGQAEPAIRELSRAAKLLPNRHEPQMDLALVYLDMKQYGPAADALEAVIRPKPELALPRILLGGPTRTAIARCWRSANSRRRWRFIPRFRWATTIWVTPTRAWGRNAEAIVEISFRKELAQHEGNSECLDGWGRALLDSARAKEALVELRQALRAEPNNADAQFALGNALLDSGTDAGIDRSAAQGRGLEPGGPAPVLPALARAYGQDAEAERSREGAAAVRGTQEASGGHGGAANG